MFFVVPELPIAAMPLSPQNWSATLRSQCWFCWLETSATWRRWGRCRTTLAAPTPILLAPASAKHRLWPTRECAKLSTSWLPNWSASTKPATRNSPTISPTVRAWRLRNRQRSMEVIGPVCLPSLLWVSPSFEDFSENFTFLWVSHFSFGPPFHPKPTGLSNTYWSLFNFTTLIL